MITLATAIVASVFFFIGLCAAMLLSSAVRKKWRKGVVLHLANPINDELNTPLEVAVSNMDLSVVTAEATRICLSLPEDERIEALDLIRKDNEQVYLAVVGRLTELGQCPGVRSVRAKS